MLHVPEGKEDCATLVERCQLTASAVKKGVQGAEGLVDNFMDGCLKFKQAKKDVMTQYRDVYKDMQKKAKLLHITFFRTKCFVFLSAVHCMLFSHPDNFRPQISILFQ